jgi:hypothetical protein
MLVDAKSIYADVEALTNTTNKQEDLNECSLTVSEWEHVVVEREQVLEVHCEAVDTGLNAS